jgi:hypothetical protein
MYAIFGVARAYMNEVEVSNRGIHQCLKRGRSNTLEYPRPQKAIIASRSSTPRAGPDEQHRPEEKEMPLAPYPGRWDGQYARDPNAQQEIACQQGNSGEGGGEKQGQRQRVCGKNGTERCRKDRGD